MAETLDDLIATLERRRQSAGPDCLAEATLERLADGTLPAADAGAARAHLGRCLACLHAYAVLRSLLEAGAVETPEVSGAKSAIIGRVRRVLSLRLPLPWTVAVAAACGLLTWTLGVVPHRAERGLARQPGGRSTIELTGESARRVSGTVSQVRDASTQGMPAHVLELIDEAGVRYTVFVWGPATVRAGDPITVQGAFSREEAPGAKTSYRGVAGVVERQRAR
jgi:hypothetical protein